ncbi:hypothetical protein KR222_004749 [Zaprionus bogoriensis]|nr:hypothetical protein KR222_004749 [Zaprionus bogoriensis]
MLRSILTFMIFVSAVRAYGELTILSSPKSLTFTGDDELRSIYVGDVLLAALGYAVTGDTSWSGMAIKDPFDLGKTSILVVYVRGVYHIPVNVSVNSYELFASETETSLDYLVSQLPKETVYNINFVSHDDGVITFRALFGNTSVPLVRPLHYLRPLEYFNHQHFLEEISYIHKISENLAAFLKPSHALILRISLDRISKVSRYETVNEAKLLIMVAVEKLRVAANMLESSVLFVQLTNRQESPKIPRDLDKPNNRNPFEKIVDDDKFPIIVNMLGWFTLTFVMIVAVACYSIVKIDPGRDSIIYRISSIDTTKKMN